MHEFLEDIQYSSNFGQELLNSPGFLRVHAFTVTPRGRLGRRVLGIYFG